MDLQSSVDELYRLTPADFTAARDSRASEARKSGDRQLAATIKQLKRPSAAAWLANLLSRECPEGVDALLRIGDHLRVAQGRLAGSELKELAREGHRVVAKLVREAERLSVAAGQRPSPAVLRQLQETLDAALADPGAAAAVRSGRLTAALSYAGLGAVADGSDAGGSYPLGSDPAGTAAPTVDPRAQAREDLGVAESRVAELTAELQSAQRRHDRLQEQLQELDRQVTQARAQESELSERIEALRASIDVASADVEEARRRIRA